MIAEGSEGTIAEDPEEMITGVKEEVTPEVLEMTGSKEEKLNVTIVKELVILLGIVRRRENQGTKAGIGIPKVPGVLTVRSSVMFPGIVLRKGSKEISR